MQYYELDRGIWGGDVVASPTRRLEMKSPNPKFGAEKPQSEGWS